MLDVQNDTGARDVYDDTVRLTNCSPCSHDAKYDFDTGSIAWNLANITPTYEAGVDDYNDCLAEYTPLNLDPIDAEITLLT